MAGWLEGIEESAFRQVPGGYVFQSPNPWLVARPNYYLVNDAQKAVIGECLRKRVRFAMVFGLLSFVVVLALFAALIVYFRQLPFPPFLIGASTAVLLLIPVLIVPHVYLMRMLGPITKDLPPTDQRFTISEQVSNVAGAVPKWLIYAGMGVILWGLIGMFDLFGSAFSIISGVILTGCFFYFASLKKR